MRISLFSYLVAILILGGSFQGFAQSGNNPCSGGSFDVVKPFLGEWEEYRITDSTEVYLGILITSLEVEGCVISQRFMSEDSSFQYLSFGHLRPSSNLWEETYVFNTGQYSVFQWTTTREGLYTFRIGGSRETDHIYRLKYTNVEPHQYEVIPQRSYDGGKTWESHGLTRIKKIQ